jgi:hypothetical protein
MVQEVPISERILEVVKAHPGYSLEEVTGALPNTSWSDVFLEVDRLSRSGNLRLFQRRFGVTSTICVSQ